MSTLVFLPCLANCFLKIFGLILKRELKDLLLILPFVLVSVTTNIVLDTKFIIFLHVFIASECLYKPYFLVLPEMPVLQKLKSVQLLITFPEFDQHLII